MGWDYIGSILGQQLSTFVVVCNGSEFVSCAVFVRKIQADPNASLELEGGSVVLFFRFRVLSTYDYPLECTKMKVKLKAQSHVI